MADLPGHLQEIYRQGREDPHLASLRDEIVLVDVRTCDLLSRLDSGEAGAVWLELHQSYNNALKARRRGDAMAMAMAFDALGQVITRGCDDYRHWDEIVRLIEVRRRLVSRMVPRAILLKQFVPIEVVTSFLANLGLRLANDIREEEDVRWEVAERLVHRLLIRMQEFEGELRW